MPVMSSSVIIIKGIPSGCDEQFLVSLIREPISVGVNPIVIWKAKAGSPYTSAVVTMASIDGATRTIQSLHGHILPPGNQFCVPGKKYKLSVDVFLKKEKTPTNIPAQPFQTPGPRQPPPQAVPTPSFSSKPCIMVHNIPSGTTALDLLTVVKCHIATLHECDEPLFIAKPKQEATKTWAKIAFVGFQDAQTTIRQLNNSVFPEGSGNRLRVEFFQEKENGRFDGQLTVRRNNSTVETPKGKPSKSVLIKGLPKGTTENFIRSFVTEQLASGEDSIEARTGKNANCTAKVQFENSNAAHRFICAYNGSQVLGTNCNLEVAYFGEKPSTTVHVAGLPKTCTEDFLLSFVKQKIATKSDGKPKITIFPAKEGKEYCFARIVFADIQATKDFIEAQDKRPAPGHKNKLSVDYFREREVVGNAIAVENKQAGKARTIIRNVVLVKGLPKTAYKKALVAALQYDNWKIAKPPRLHETKNGDPKGEAVFSFENHLAAQRFIDKYNGKPYPTPKGNGPTMHASLFESTNIRRLPDAQGNHHLFKDGAVGYAYECVACLDYWDERDMLGCVAVDSGELDMETHYVCQSCARRFSKALMTDGMVGKWGTGLPCGTQGCGRINLWAPVKRLLEENVWKVLEKRMDNAALLGFDDIEYCKYCEYGVIIEQNTTQKQFFDCQKPGCMRRFCRRCRVDSEPHRGKSCDEVDPKRQLRALEDQLNSALIRKCPKCSLQFVKDGGCNFMTCRCGNTMCYLCKTTPITGSHFTSTGCSPGTDADAFIRAQQDQLKQAADPAIRKALQDKGF